MAVQTTEEGPVDDWVNIGSIWLSPLTWVIGLLISLVLTFLVRRLVKQRLLPPGPCGVPFLGVLPRMGPKPYLTIQKWWKLYGDVFSMYMGSRFVVVVNGLPAMTEVFVTQGGKCLARPWNFFRKLARNSGIVFSDVDTWREHRSFTISFLQEVGVGQQNMEMKILEEARYILDEFRKELKRVEPGSLEGNQGRINPRRTISKAVSNIICSIIYGSRFDYSDAVFQANVDALEGSVRKQSQMGMIQFIPLMEILPRIMPKDQQLMKNVQMRDRYAAEQLTHHKETLDREHPRDLIDAYFIRMMALREAEDETTMEDRHLHRMIQDLFILGSGSATATLRWAFLFMMLNPNVQEKVYKEIVEVIGRGHQPKIHHRAVMPYTCATLCECQRRGNISLFSNPRLATDDIHVDGRIIPKGAWIYMNRWGMHASALYWQQPEKFDPTRFLDGSGQFTRPEAFVPFGAGPRMCIGEGLAQMELFLFFTSVIQAFRLCIPNDMPTPSLEPCFGINMAPNDYEMSIVIR